MHILVQSRIRNEDLAVTGYLHWEDGIFHQWIEGPMSELRTVEEVILTDRLHHDITILDRGETSLREFEGWSMAASASESSSLFNFMATNEIASRDHHAHAQGVLRFMKEQLQQDADLLGGDPASYGSSST